jgi:2-polyprenyl-3-methyl-5-hydroxy-6-metoxy-1,4-benzoquinol methylase
LRATQYTARDHEFRRDDAYAQAKYRITLRWLDGPVAGRALLFNVGCGVGLFNQVAVSAGYSVEAFEPEDGPFKEAIATQPVERCRVRQASLAEIEGEAMADVIVMHDVLEHIEDEASALRTVRRLVSDSGRVILSVPALGGLFGLHDEMLGHYRRYSKRSLQKAVEPYFVVHRLRYFGLTFIPITMWFSRIRRAPYPIGMAAGRSVASRAFRLLCSLESWFPGPLGTSLVCELRPKPL